jgi:hypothetical protein
MNLLDVYYTGWTVGCQVNFSLTADPFDKLRTGCADSHGLRQPGRHEGNRGSIRLRSGQVSRISRTTQTLPRLTATENTEDTEKKKFEIRSTKSETNPKFKCSNGQNEKEPRISQIRAD